ncbi:MAG: hypothetical protein KGJ80_10865 [Chloroflexota bacterium]|nr:hypothetical protein [Chloroflexota bacterium]
MKSGTYLMLLRGAALLAVASFALFVLAHGAWAQGATDSALSIQINQALGTQSDKFVAGKDTVIRVVLKEPLQVNPADQKVVVKRGGETVATLEPQPADAPQRILNFTCPSRAACGDWKAGDYTFEATIGTATATATAKFQERRALRLLAVGVKANYGPGDVRVPNDRWKKQGEYMRQVFPIGPDSYKWIIGQDLDLSDDKYNLKTDEGMREVWMALANLQPQECTANPKGPTCYDLIIGFVKDRQGKESNIQGYTMGAPANVVTESDEDAPATVAHEVAHVFGIGDEYDQMNGAFNCPVNPPPSSFVGRDWNNRENTSFKCDASKAEPFPIGTGSIVKAEVDYPYEVGGRGALPDMISYMGSGAPQDKNWTTAAIWSWLFDQLAPGGTIAMLHKAAPVTPLKYVAAFGMIGKEGNVTLEPWYTFTDTTVIKEKPGKYSIQAVDAMSNTLATQPFDLQFITLSNPPRPIDPAPFEIAVPFPDMTAAFRIMSGDKVLKVVPVTPNAPEVKIVAPTAGEAITGTYTIKWQGSDKDGDKPLYTVEYSDNGEDWVTLAAEIEMTEWTDDFGTIPGGDKPMGRIKITATDGINATDVTSELFSVPPKSPEVFIEEPEKDITVKAGEEITLSGGAYDLQDEWIFDDKKLVWTSDLQGELGGGESLYVDNLKPGKHTITLKATNSFNLSSTAKVVVSVTEK